jgi:hypothetical protein
MKIKPSNAYKNTENALEKHVFEFRLHISSLVDYEQGIRGDVE